MPGGTRWVDDAVQDLRFAARLLVRGALVHVHRPIAALALGIAVNMSVFAIVTGMNLAGLPVDRPEQIVDSGSLELRGRATGMGVSYADLRDWQTATQTFSGLAAYTAATINVGDADRPADRVCGMVHFRERLQPAWVRPQLGRDFSAGDDRPDAAPVVMLGARCVERALRRGSLDCGPRHPRSAARRPPSSGSCRKGSVFRAGRHVAADWDWGQASPVDPRDRRRLGVFGRIRDGVGILDRRGRKWRRLLRRSPAISRHE